MIKVMPSLLSFQIGIITAKTEFDVQQFESLFGSNECPIHRIEYLDCSFEYHISITKRSIDRNEPSIPESKHQDVKDESLVVKDELSNGCE